MASDLQHTDFEQRHRGGMLLERHGLELYLHPFLGFTLQPGLRSAMLNTDEQGFRFSDSPFGPVDSASWRADGGGGLVLGNSPALGLAASTDGDTVVSRLAELTGERQLNLGLCAASSLQEVVAAVPFLEQATTVVVIGGGTDLINLAGSVAPPCDYGTISYERTFDDLVRLPLFDLATLAAGKSLPDVDALKRAPRPAPRWSVDQIAEKVETAAARRVRDLRVLAGAVPSGTRVLFCLQPFATPRFREFTDAEKARYDFDAPVFGILHSSIEELWPTYSTLIGDGCEGLGIGFLDLEAGRFTGDAFADTVHPNDAGYRQAARMIFDALPHTPPTH